MPVQAVQSSGALGRTRLLWAPESNALDAQRLRWFDQILEKASEGVQKPHYGSLPDAELAEGATQRRHRAQRPRRCARSPPPAARRAAGPVSGRGCGRGPSLLAGRLSRLPVIRVKPNHDSRTGIPYPRDRFASFRTVPRPPSGGLSENPPFPTPAVPAKEPRLRYATQIRHATVPLNRRAHPPTGHAHCAEPSSQRHPSFTKPTSVRSLTSTVQLSRLTPLSGTTARPTSITDAFLDRVPV